ncbi:MAG: XrtA/PEP-CTERM system TPR-repeat protein PrsT [Thiobacillaceae bacterium]
MQLRPVTAALLIAMLSSPLLPGCSKLAKATPEEHIQRSKDAQAKGDLKTSIIELKSAIEEQPNNAQARLLLGDVYIKAQQGSAAEKELRKAKQLGVNNESIKVSLGEALLLQGEYKKVLNEIQSTPETSPLNQARIFRLHGDAMLGLGQFDEGCAQYKQSLAVDKSYVPAYWGLAKCALAHRDLAEARQQIEIALKVDQANPDTWVFLGEFEKYNKNLTAAETAFSHALKIDPKHKAALIDRALIYLQQHRYDLAQADLAKIKKFAPNHPLTYFLEAAVQYGTGNYQASLESLQQVFKDQPNFMPAVRLAGIVQYNLRIFEQANKNLQQYLNRFPDDLQVRKLLAATLLTQGQGDQALQLLNPVLATGNSDDSQLLALAGQAYQQNKNPSAAAEQFEKAAAIDPKNVGLHTQLGISLVSAGQTAQGITELENAVKLDPSQSGADLSLVLVYLQQSRFDNALWALADFEKKQPNNPNIYILKGVAYLGKNDPTNARKSYERALVVRPASVPAAMNLVQLDLREKKTADARRRLDAILSSDKSNLQAMLTMAETASAEGKEQESLAWLDRAAKANPTAVQPRVIMARYFLAKNQPQKALSFAREAISAQPRDPLALETLGTMQLAAGDKDNALVTFKQLVEEMPNSALAYYRLASAHAALGNFAKSRDALNKALELDPKYVDAQNSLAILDLREGKLAEALKIAKQIQQSNPKLAIGPALEGDVLMAQKQYVQAAKAYESTLALQRTWAVVVKMHTAYSQAGRRKDGEEHILQWLRENPHDDVARLYLAQAYMTTGQNREAIEQFRTLLQSHPNEVTVLNDLAWLYQQEKNPLALEFAERAYKLAPNASFVLDTLGWILVEQDKVQRGQELLKKGLSLSPRNPSIKYHLAVALTRSGDRAGARKLLEELLATRQDFPELQETRNLLNHL